MEGNEPVTLYASAASRCALLSVRSGASAESHFLAIPGEGGREKMSGLGTQAPEQVNRALRERMERSGGVWTLVEQTGGESYVSARPWPAAEYAPPSKLLIVSLNDSVRAHPLPAERIRVGTVEHALLPVDAASEAQLDHWIAGLEGLPGDLRVATLHSLVNDGIITPIQPKVESLALRESAVPQAESPHVARSWLWLALASLAAFAIGGALGFTAHHFMAQPPAIVKPAPEEALAAPLKDLEAVMAVSTDAQIQSLYQNHIAPFSLEPASGTAKRTADAWMILKLILYQQGRPLIPEWSLESNRQARQDYQALKIPPGEQNLLTAVECYAGSFPAGATADPAACSKVKWPEALQESKALSQFAAAGRKPAPSPGGHKP